jgi:hypothetical protein
MSLLDIVISKEHQQQFRDNRRRWSFGRSEAVSPSRAIVGQRCKITGRAEPVQALLATPFRGDPAILCCASVSQAHFVDSSTSGGRAQVWSRKFEDHVTRPFDVTDDSGARIRVDAASGYTLAPLVQYHDATNAPVLATAALPPGLETYLRSHGVITNGFMGVSGDALFEEAVLAPMATVTVSGVVEEISEVIDDGYRSAPTRSLRMVGTNEEPLILSF